MEDICLGVSSFFFIPTACGNTQSRNHLCLNTVRLSHYPLGSRNRAQFEKLATAAASVS